MTEFALAHPWLTFVIVTELGVMATMVLRAMSRAATAWGTRHCGSCACHMETTDGDSDEATKR